MDLVDFGFRPTQGVEAGLAAGRLSAVVGFSATINVEAARRYRLHPAGTMAHSYIEAFPTELDAFTAFARDLPARTTFLVDTYDTHRHPSCHRSHSPARPGAPGRGPPRQRRSRTAGLRNPPPA